MTDNDSTSTLSREDALTLECYDTEEEMNIETYIVEESDDDEDYPETESESDSEDDEYHFWPSDEQIGIWDHEDAQWRNFEAHYYDEFGYDPNGEI